MSGSLVFGVVCFAISVSLRLWNRIHERKYRLKQARRKIGRLGSRRKP